MCRVLGSWSLLPNGEIGYGKVIVNSLLNCFEVQGAVWVTGEPDLVWSSGKAAYKLFCVSFSSTRINASQMPGLVSDGLWSVPQGRPPPLGQEPSTVGFPVHIWAFRFPELEWCEHPFEATPQNQDGLAKLGWEGSVHIPASANMGSVVSLSTNMYWHQLYAKCCWIHEWSKESVVLAFGSGGRSDHR